MSYDIELNEDGSMPLYPRLFRGRRKIAQAVKIAINQHTKEHLPDKTKGMAYQDWIEQLWRPLQAIGGTIRSELLAVPGVTSVTEFSIAKVGEKVTVVARLETEDGEEFGVRVELPSEPRGNLMPLVYSSLDSKRFMG